MDKYPKSGKASLSKKHKQRNEPKTIKIRKIV